MGLIYQPALDKLFVAEKGKGAFLNQTKIAVSHESELIKSLIATDSSSKIDKREDSFAVLSKICADVRHIRIFGSCALHMSRVAQGQLDFYYKSGFNYWDYAAGMLIVEAAGGKVTDFDGNPITQNSKNILASNSLLHEKALKLING